MTERPRPVGWGVIGTGEIVRSHMLDALAGDARSRVIGVLSGDRSRARMLAAARGVRWWPDLVTMLSDPEVDAVYIASTHDRHAEQASLAARAGKHVLCEKPLALSHPDAASAVQSAISAGVVLAINHPLRGLATLRGMRDVIAAGAIGRPLTCRFAYAIRPEFADTSWYRQGPAAGVLFDLGIHTVDCARFLLGAEAVDVRAIGLTDPGWSAAHSVMLLLQMTGGTLVSTSESFLAEGARNGIEIQGTEGAIIADGAIGGLELASTWELRRGGRIEIRGSATGPTALFPPTIHAFVDAIHGTGEPLAPGADHLDTLDVVLAAQRMLHS